MASSRAVQLEEFGPPEVLRIVDTPTPEPGPGQALVRVKACALNGFELLMRKGSYRPYESVPHVMGGDIAGIVEAYGPGCRTDLPTGTEVLLYYVIACGHCEPCLQGQPNTCLSYGYLGAKYRGGYADYVVVPEDNLVAIPASVDMVTAASFPLGYCTAWHQLFSRGQLQAGEWLMVMAGGSGIGSAAIQMGKLAGAKIIATAGSKEKCDKTLALGADYAIDYRKQDLVAEVRGITGKRGVDIVFEHVGGPMFEDVVRCVTRNGRIVTCGGTAGYQISFNVAHIFHKQISIIGSNSGTKWELERMLPYLADGRLKPVVDSVFPLEDAVKAHHLLEARSAFGKVVLTTDD